MTQGQPRYAYNLWFYNAGHICIFTEEMIPMEVKSLMGGGGIEKKAFAKKIV